MARTSRKVGMEGIDRQIEEAQAALIKAKKKYDEATQNLKKLLQKKKEMQTVELMEAIQKSKRTYTDILRFINSDPDEEL